MCLKCVSEKVFLEKIGGVLERGGLVCRGHPPGRGGRNRRGPAGLGMVLARTGLACPGFRQRGEQVTKCLHLGLDSVDYVA